MIEYDLSDWSAISAFLVVPPILLLLVLIDSSDRQPISWLPVSSFRCNPQTQLYMKWFNLIYSLQIEGSLLLIVVSCVIFVIYGVCMSN